MRSHTADGPHWPFFPCLQTHSHHTELSSHVSEIQLPHGAISGAERCRICLFFSKVPFWNASTNNLQDMLHIILQTQLSRSLRFADCVSKFLFPLIDSLIFQHCLWNKSMQSSSWRWQDCWNTDYKVNNWLLYASLMGHQVSFENMSIQGVWIWWGPVRRMSSRFCLFLHL